MIVEVLCGSIEECLIAQKQGADRIELNSAPTLGGLTPSIGLVKEAIKHVDIPIVPMIRCRMGKFTYTDLEYDVMFKDAKVFLDLGVNGLVFGFLNEDNTVNIEKTAEMVKLIHSYGKEAIFHRAIDVSEDIETTMQQLISMNIDRVLTSGGHTDAYKGRFILQTLNEKYGDKIEILPGGGIDKNNIQELLEVSGLKQVHGSFKHTVQDIHNYTDNTKYDDYFIVDENHLSEVIHLIK